MCTVEEWGMEIRFSQIGLQKSDKNSVRLQINFCSILIFKDIMMHHLIQSQLPVLHFTEQSQLLTKLIKMIPIENYST
jgi:hypothetical protein